MSLITVPLIGYASDLDPTQPGVFSYSKGMVATARGWKMRWHPSSVATVTWGASDFMLGGLASNITDGTEVVHVARRDVSAVKDKLYRLNGSALTDASVAGSYTYASLGYWSFCQYGIYTIATNLVDPVQYRDASGSSAFANTGATGIPKAAICVTWGPPTSPRVMLLNYNDGTAYYDGWWSSHQGGPLSAWSVDVATGAVNGRLLGAGTLTCALAIGDDVIAWSDTQMWFGRFVGPPFICQWRRISDRVGCLGPYAATVVDNIAYWVSTRGAYQFSPATGMTPLAAPIQDQLIRFFNASTINSTIKVSTHLASDITSQYLYLQPSLGVSGNNTNSNVLGINIRNNRVGQLDETAANQTRMYLERGYSLTYDNSAIGAGSGVVTLYKENTSETFHAVSGDGYGFGLNYMGENKGYTRLKGVIPRFITAPFSYTMTDYFGPTLSEATSTATAVSVSATPWRADLLKSDRWHAPRFVFVNYNGAALANMEMSDCLIDVVEAGKA